MRTIREQHYEILCALDQARTGDEAEGLSTMIDSIPLWARLGPAGATWWAFANAERDGFGMVTDELDHMRYCEVRGCETCGGDGYQLVHGGEAVGHPVGEKRKDGSVGTDVIVYRYPDAYLVIVEQAPIYPGMDKHPPFWKRHRDGSERFRYYEKRACLLYGADEVYGHDWLNHVGRRDTKPVTHINGGDVTPFPAPPAVLEEIPDLPPALLQGGASKSRPRGISSIPFGAVCASMQETECTETTSPPVSAPSPEESAGSPPVLLDSSPSLLPSTPTTLGSDESPNSNGSTPPAPPLEISRCFRAQGNSGASVSTKPSMPLAAAPANASASASPLDPDTAAVAIRALGTGGPRKAPARGRRSVCAHCGNKIEGGWRYVQSGKTRIHLECADGIQQELVCAGLPVSEWETKSQAFIRAAIRQAQDGGRL